MLLSSFIVPVLVLYLTSLLLGDKMAFEGIWSVILTAGVIGLLNFFVAPIIAFLTCPLQLLTLGLARFFISGLMIVVASHLLSSFSIASYWWAVLAGITISLLTSAFEGLFKIKK